MCAYTRAFVVSVCVYLFERMFIAVFAYVGLCVHVLGHLSTRAECLQNDPSQQTNILFVISQQAGPLGSSAGMGNK